MIPSSFKSGDYPVVLFDSQCLICDGFVRWIIRRDDQRILKFSGLKSEIAQDEINRRKIDFPKNGSVVMLYPGKFYIESDAVIEIMRIINQPLFLIEIFSSIPRTWRDAAYRLIAGNRYLFRKKRNECYRPGRSTAERFIYTHDA